MINSTASYVELMWTLLALIGAAVSLGALRDVFKTHATDALEKLIVGGDQRNESVRLGVQLVFATVGVLSTTLPNPPAWDAGPRLAIGIVLIVGEGLIVANSLLDRRDSRRKLSLAAGLLSRESVVTTREGASDARDAASEIREAASDIISGSQDVREEEQLHRDIAQNKRKGVQDKREVSQNQREEDSSSADVGRQDIQDLRGAGQDQREISQDQREASQNLRDEDRFTDEGGHDDPHNKEEE